MFGLLSFLFKVLGIGIVSYGQIDLWLRARRKYGCIQNAFFDMFAGGRWIDRVRSVEEIRQLSKDEVSEMLGKFPLASWLYDDFRISVVGLAFTIVGTLLEPFLV